MTHCETMKNCENMKHYEKIKYHYKKGMTLVELYASISIMFFLSISFLWLLLTGKTMWQSSLTYTDSHQKLRFIFSKLTADIRSSNVFTLTRFDGSSVDDKGFSLLSAFDAQNQFITNQLYGTPIWQKYIVYCIQPGSNTLFRKEIYDLASPRTQAQFNTECDGQGNRLTDSISTFTIVPNITNRSVNVTVGVSETSQHGSVNQLNFTKTMVMQN